MHNKTNSRLWLFFLLFSYEVVSDSSAIPQTVVCQAPLSMGFSRQEYWSGLPFPSPGDLPNPGTEPTSPALPGGFSNTEPSVKCSHFLCLFVCFVLGLCCC